jgi:hypothetical protein
VNNIASIRNKIGDAHGQASGETKAASRGAGGQFGWNNGFLSSVDLSRTEEAVGTIRPQEIME